MKTITTLLLLATIGYGASAQVDTITNGGFERWGNTVPTGDTCTEPTSWYSNQSGSSTARLGGETCFKDASIVHSGLYSVRIETISGPLGTVVNGSVTTGVINAPSFIKSDGYIGTVNYSTSTDDRRMPFTGRPDSIVGWYRYTPAAGGTPAEMGKIRAILHTGDYYDPETPTTYHASCAGNMIADDTFYTPTTSVTTWTRFSMPFIYVSSATPSYIMINATPSANQGTTVTGSTLWIDDLAVVYNPSTSVSSTAMKEEDANVYSYEKTVCVQFLNGGNPAQSVITLMDVTGKKVFSQSVTNNKFSSYNLSDLATGVYIYQLSNSNYRKTGKLFIQ